MQMQLGKELVNDKSTGGEASKEGRCLGELISAPGGAWDGEK